MEVVAKPVVWLTRVEQRLWPDVVIAGVNNSEPGERARALLARWPRSHVLIITARGEQVVLYELQPQSTDLGEISPTRLVQAIRSAVRSEDKLYTH